MIEILPTVMKGAWVSTIENSGRPEVLKAPAAVARRTWKAPEPSRFADKLPRLVPGIGQPRLPRAVGKTILNVMGQQSSCRAWGCRPWTTKYILRREGRIKRYNKSIRIANQDSRLCLQA